MVAGIASPGGASARILGNILAGRLDLVASPEIRDEYYSIASRKGIVALFARHGVQPEFYRLELDAICLIAENTSPTGEAPPCRDDDDRKYLHCANFAAVDFLVTYDRDLLDLHSAGEVPIITPAELLQRANDAGVTLVK